ncbi:CrcB family protein [Demequina sp. NBRC 110057]|uniref:fluoride efflux transporter FluC n=1 Tax=Demequina sp. NBRC 110057 TaxID=1570346 RepID=UPI0013562D0F|nr:CrcB family protein [Demequina sp. NBRC 110057]
MTAWAYAAAILGCGIGAVGRHLLAQRIVAAAMPWQTIVANTLAAALVGAVAGVADAHPAWMLVLGAGVGGGLSTFSTLAVDGARLWEAGERRRAAAYLAVTFALGVGAAWAGWLVTS